MLGRPTDQSAPGAINATGAQSISIVVPLYNGNATLPRVLPSLEDAVRRGDAVELIIVDDCSTDSGTKYCRERGLVVLRNEVRSGPGAARNLGVAAAKGEIVLFIDSDVVMHPAVPLMVQTAFREDAAVGAVFGSYDDRPAANGVVSQYLNLRHHYMHHCGKEKADTFWAGCGAVDRAAFLECGGFDAERYPHPSIEDIELGHRLRRLGWVIMLKKEMRCTHLKRWTLRTMIHTDVFRRALPWARLMQEPGYRTTDLNLRVRERFKAGLAACFWIAVVASAFRPEAAAAAGGLLALAFLANLGFFSLILRRAGAAHMLAGLLLHQLYYTYSSVVFAFCFVEARVNLRRA